MKFHRIMLRDYRAIRLLTVEPREDGITIFQGDNEVGKTSIAEALWLIFEQHDDSASKLVASIRPADRDVATEIEVEVSTGPYRFTYFKRFHRGARTELRLSQPKREVLAGREADNRANAILRETIDMALWKALRFQQGAAENLEQLPAGQHQSLLAALEGAAGTVMGGEREQTLFERVGQEYERYFTASGREKNAGEGPNANRLRQARDAAAADVERLQQRIATLEERALRATALDHEIAQLAARHGLATVQAAELASIDSARREQKGIVDSLGSELRACEAALRESAAAHEARTRAVAAIAPRTEELAELRARLEALAPSLAEAGSANEAAQTALKVAEDLLTTSARARDGAEEALHVASAEFTAQTMAERLERLEKNQPELARVETWLKECRIDARGLAQIEQAEERLTRARAKREAEGASVEVAALEGVEFEIDGKPVRVEAGRARRGTVLGETKISLPGGVTITVRAGTAARDLEAQIAEAQAHLDQRLGAAGVESAEGANALMRQRAASEERRRGLLEQVTADMRDLSSVDELRRKLQRERARIDGLRETGALLTIDQAKTARDAASAALAAAETAAKDARATAAECARALVDLERERDQLAERCSNLGTEVERLQAGLDAARAGIADELLLSVASDADANRVSASAKLDAATASLQGLRDVSAELEAATADLRDTDATTTRLSHERAAIRGVLEDAGAAGLHGQLTEAEQALAGAEDELDAYLRRARAARTLFEAMSRHHAAARENYAEPLRLKIESLGKLVYGGDFGVELSEDLRVVRRTQGGLTLDVANLSIGVREQLSVLTRLACASLVGDGGGAPLVLDDVFGWADPGRLKKLGPILARAASDTQVLLFTCTPERFASVVPAKVVSLPSGSSEERLESPGTQPVVLPVAAPGATPSRRLAPARPAAASQPQAAFDLFADPEAAASRQ